MDAIVQTMLAFVLAATGLPAPEAPPRIELVPHQFFVQTVCRGDAHCDAQGWSSGEDTAREFPGFQPGVIYLDERLDFAQDPYARGLLAHELTHYAQQQSGAFGPSLVADCVARIRSEAQAVLVQARYLATQGIRFEAPAAMRMYRCRE